MDNKWTLTLCHPICYQSMSTMYSYVTKSWIPFKDCKLQAPHSQATCQINMAWHWAKSFGNYAPMFATMTCMKLNKQVGSVFFYNIVQPQIDGRNINETSKIFKAPTVIISVLQMRFVLPSPSAAHPPQEHRLPFTGHSVCGVVTWRL